jgi:hypothetical protein
MTFGGRKSQLIDRFIFFFDETDDVKFRADNEYFALLIGVVDSNVEAEKEQLVKGNDDDDVEYNVGDDDDDDDDVDGDGETVHELLAIEDAEEGDDFIKLLPLFLLNGTSFRLLLLLILDLLLDCLLDSVLLLRDDDIVVLGGLTRGGRNWSWLWLTVNPWERRSNRLLLMSSADREDGVDDDGDDKGIGWC